MKFQEIVRQPTKLGQQHLPTTYIIILFTYLNCIYLYFIIRNCNYVFQREFFRILPPESALANFKNPKRDTKVLHIAYLLPNPLEISRYLYWPLLPLHFPNNPFHWDNLQVKLLSIEKLFAELALCFPGVFVRAVFGGRGGGCPKDSKGDVPGGRCSKFSESAP